jgi:sec-independent protein translocase protein TatA
MEMIKDLLLNIAGTEWIWIVVVLVVVLFGASKIPEVARSIGKATGEFQRGKMEIQKEIEAAAKEMNKTPERLKLEEAARAFGIDPTGKTDEQLKEEIKKAA